jgi:predicted porin
MKTRTLIKSLLTVGIATAVASTQAAELRVNGFASIVGGRTISDEKLPSGSNTKYVVAPPFAIDSFPDANDSAAYDDDFNFKPETNMGLQLSADLGDGLSVVAQLTAQGANDFDAEAEWLYVSYDVSSQFNIKGGKQRIPFYMYSDFLDVGYAYHWIRPPVDVYGSAFSSYVGVSGTYSGNVGNWDTSLLGYYGATDNDTGTFGDIVLDDLWGLVLSGSYDWLQLRASFHQADVEAEDVTALDTQPYADGEAEGAWFASVGAMANLGNFFIGAEITRTSFDELLATAISNTIDGGFEVGVDETNTWMITAGYRMGAWTPHISFSTSTSDTKANDIDGNGTTTTGALGLLVDEEDSRETWILGLRYDFHPSAAFKIEYTDRSDESDNGYTTVFGKRREVSTFAFGVDLIF